MILVQKYGGSSLSDATAIKRVAHRIVQAKKQGYDVVVAVSAMGDSTDELLDLANEVSPLPPAREFPDKATMFAALRAGEITAGWTGTADTGVPSDLVVLADRKPELVTAENIVPLYRRNELDDPQVRAINELAGVLDTGSLVDMRQHVAEGRDPRTVAEEWLSAHPLGR